ncbi:MAG TPA: hypothetical protein VNA26_03985 [Chitinophagaceae bacterium]|nr:hypothetical protein [Chitinophagaceae bacterium]
MKTILLLITCAINFGLCNTIELQVEKVNDIPSPKVDTINFKTQIQPIFQKNCSPCHFTGGKMYEKMPFDKGETILSHEAGIVKRIKDTNELILVKRFIKEKK